MKQSIPNKIRVVAIMLRLSTATPKQIVRAMGAFRDLLRDKSNFIDPEKWGSLIEGKRVMPFSFSQKGLSEIEILKDKYPEFKKIYSGGIAGIKGEYYNLIYFLSHFLELFPMFEESLEFRKPSDENEKGIIESLKDKYNAVEHDENMIRKLISISAKPVSENEYNKLKNQIFDIIRRIENNYKKVDLSEKEEAYVLKH